MVTAEALQALAGDTDWDSIQTELQDTIDAASRLDEGKQICNAADAAKIRSDLYITLLTAWPEADAAKQEYAEVSAACAAEEAELERIVSEMRECARRASNAQAATRDADLTTRIEARSLRNAFLEEAEALSAQAGEQQNILSGAESAKALARQKASQAAAAVSDVLAALADPLGHPRGRKTSAYLLREMSGRSLPALWDLDSPEHQAATVFVAKLAHLTGRDRVIARQVIEEYKSSGMQVAGADGRLRRMDLDTLTDWLQDAGATRTQRKIPPVAPVEARGGDWRPHATDSVREEARA